MTMNDKLELALDIARRRGLPPSQIGHPETLIGQLFTFALDAQVVADRNALPDTDGVCLVQPGSVNAINQSIADLLLVVALDVYNVFGNAITEKGKEEGKEKIPPHPPIEKGPEESQKDCVCSARAGACAGAREGDDDDDGDDFNKEEFNGFFQLFWEEYPNGHRLNKGETRKRLMTRYKKAKDKNAFMSLVIEGLHKWKACDRWARGVIVHPERFVSQERWLETPPNTTSESMRTRRGVSQTANVKANRGCQW